MVEAVGICQVMWLVMIESTKNRILGVDTLGQQVLPRVWYGTTCLLIRADISCESCSVVWENMQNMI
jgi:ABC-type dipeptide/oligopeptide/nickel transport system permease subunit